jgi:hypothetical protein
LGNNICLAMDLIKFSFLLSIRVSSPVVFGFHLKIFLTILMVAGEVWCDSVSWVLVCLDRVQWRALVNMVIPIQVLYNIDLLNNFEFP